MAAKGGENPELQVTDHGSDIACMQTGRGRKKIHWLGGKKDPSVLFPSRRLQAPTKSVPRIGRKTMRRKLDVYCSGNEVYRPLLDSAIAN